MASIDEIKAGINNLPNVKDIDSLIAEGKYESHDIIAEAITTYLNDLGEYIHHDEDEEHSPLEIINQSGIVNVLKEKGYGVVLEENDGDYSIGVDW